MPACRRNTATRTDLVVDVHGNLDPRPVRRQRAPIALRRPGARRIGGSGVGSRRWRVRRREHRVESGLLLGYGLLEVFLSLLEGRVIELFRAATEPLRRKPASCAAVALDLGQGRRSGSIVM
jgi:hypothetical protein